MEQPAHGRGWELDDLSDPFQPKTFYDSMTSKEDKGVKLIGSLTPCAQRMLLGKSPWACAYGKIFCSADLIQML